MALSQGRRGSERVILLHGTTRQRAERIIQQGPDPSFQEPGGRDVSEEFSMNLEIGPFLFGSVKPMPEARPGNSRRRAAPPSSSWTSPNQL